MKPLRGAFAAHIELVVNALTTDFNLTCSLYNTDKGSRIYINKTSTNIIFKDQLLTFLM
jgi:hypothetical protein